MPSVTPKDIERMLPNPVTLHKWYCIGPSNSGVQAMLVWSKARGRSYVHVRKLIRAEACNSGSEYYRIRETGDNQWKEE